MKKVLPIAGAFGLFLVFTAIKNVVVQPAAVKVATATNMPKLAALLA